MGVHRPKAAPGSDHQVGPCPHRSLLPRWDRLEDVGIDTRTAYYLCESCGGDLPVVQARYLLAEEARRLRAQ